MKNQQILLALFLPLLLSCSKKNEIQKSSANQITSFKIDGVTAQINSVNKKIKLLSTKSLKSLVPTISISEKATIQPKSGVAQDFTKPVTYTITAEDGSTNTYTVENAIYSFSYNKNKYDIVKISNTWNEAVKFAIKKGGYLAQINDKEEQNAIYQELISKANINLSDTKNKFGKAAVWLGGHDLLEEGKWIWDGDYDKKGTQFWSGGMDGTSVNNSYTNWGLEPDNAVGGQNVLSIAIEDTPRNKKSQWNDLAGDSNNLYYVIEYTK